MNLKNVELGTWIRTAFLLLSLLNQGLAIFGFSPIPIDEENVTMAISSILTTASALWAWWKNNSITDAAQKADEKLKEFKTEE